jgi:plasmid replication initiation protein
MGLKPLKHPQGELFVCDITDVVLKGDMASMEHPFYSLSKNPDREPRRYQHGNKWIEFRPSIRGLPTIYDKDLIIYAISHAVAAKNEADKRGESFSIPKTVEIDPYAFLIYTERGTGGRDYDALCHALDRLDGTRFRTNIISDGTRSDEWMGIIDKAKLLTDDATGKPLKLTITLSDMVTDAIERMEVLTFNKDYFRLGKPIERRVYELARKHCGRKDEFSIGLEKLHSKAGSRGNLREFRRAIKQLVEDDHLPDYHVEYEREIDTVRFKNRESWWQGTSRADLPPLPSSAYEKARKFTRDDIYAVESEWREWWRNSGSSQIQNIEAAFIGFVKKRASTG